MNDLFSAIATALGDLRRSPGKGFGWVDHVLDRLAEIRFDDYERLRRTLGLGHGLAELAELDPEESARVTVGLFLNGLLDNSWNVQAEEPPRRWVEYMFRNDDWLGPCLRVAQSLHSPPEEDLEDSRATIVATGAVTFDTETMVNGRRPIDVLQSLRPESIDTDVEPTTALLCSEKGQALCDRHVRYRGQNYSAEPAVIKGAMTTLKSATPDLVSSSEPTVVAPQRLTDHNLSRRREEPKEEKKPEDAATTPGNFERRREALKSSISSDELRGADSSGVSATQAGGTDPDGQTGGLREPAAEPDSATETGTDLARALASDEGDPTGQGPPEANYDNPKEAAMENEGDSAATGANGDRPDLAEKLEELKAMLAQIKEVAAEGEAVLVALGPQVEEFAAKVGDFEAVMSRWKDRERQAPQRAR